ncbi:MAG: DUF1501 domain-containing protein [Planctomycetes bacterium]|nr:DUF1501 domain-containing protein [Planctomycetota bacterium]
MLMNLARRDFLRIGGGLAVAGLSSGHASGDDVVSSGARSCILIYLLGGPPHLDMWDLKPLAPAEIRGPFRPIATTVPGLRICEHMPRLARQARRFALVRSVSHNNHNHTPMIFYTLTGRQVEQPGVDNDIRPPQRSDFPHLGAVLARLKPSPTGLPGYVAIPELAIRSSLEGEFKRARTALRGGAGGFLGPLVDPLSVNGDPGTRQAIPSLSLPAEVNAARMERRAALLSVLEYRGPGLPAARTHRELRRQAVVLSGATGGTSAIFSLDGEPQSLRERYGRHRFGRAMILARRLAEAGVPMTAIHFNEMTICDGWDTHSRNFEALERELLPMLDQSLSALLDDLDQRGLLEQTLVVVMGEFGRTPRINGQAGRDHWGSCQSVLLAGGGVRGGQVIGASDRIAAYPATDAIDPVDIHATMYHCLGLNPEHIVHDHLRRPYPICTGKVVEGLV